MNQETIEDFKQKHFENYKNAVLETLKNNTISLFDDDVLFLLKKPPLDSMDIIKCKFLELAKRHRTIIQADALDKILENYRKKIITYIPSWKKIRIEELQKKLDQEIENKDKIVNKNINTYEQEDGIDIYVTYEVLENIGTNEKIVF